MFVNVSSRDAGNSHHSSVKSDNSLSYPSRTVVHPKLEMTEPGDADEQEADLAAHDVMSGKVFRKFSGGGAGGGMAVSSQMESQLNQLQGGGQAMPDGLRGMMERGFDRDFSQVRLHTDGEAAGLSNSIHAKAFTHGNDIYFNQGQYAPETSEGQRLVAHELAHVAQGGGKVGREDDPLSKEFDEHFKGFIHCLTPGLTNPISSVEFEVDPNKYKSDVSKDSVERKMIDCHVYAYEAIAYMENRINNPKKDPKKEKSTRKKIRKIYENHFNHSWKWTFKPKKGKKKNSHMISDYVIIYDGKEIGDVSEIAESVGLVGEITSHEDREKLIKAVEDNVKNEYQKSTEYKNKLNSRISMPIKIGGRIYYPIVFEDHESTLFRFEESEESGKSGKSKKSGKSGKSKKSGKSWYLANNGEVYKFRTGNKDELKNPDVIVVDKHGVPSNIENVIKKVNEIHDNEFTYYYFREKRYEIPTNDQ